MTKKNDDATVVLALVAITVPKSDAAETNSSEGFSSIHSRVSTRDYLDGWERIFGSAETNDKVLN